MSNAIVQQALQAIEQLNKSDLLSAETAQALVKAAAEITEQKKAIEAQDKAIKDNVKRMFADEMAAEQNVCIYDFDSEMKISLVARGGSVEVDDYEFMKAVYAYYGEEIGDQDGMAWKAFCAVTDPLPCPRTLNPDKLEAALDAMNLVADAKHAATTPAVNEGMVKAATVVKQPTYAASCSAMSKAELAAHAGGELVDNVVVKERG